MRFVGAIESRALNRGQSQIQWKRLGSRANPGKIFKTGVGKLRFSPRSDPYRYSRVCTTRNGCRRCLLCRSARSGSAGMPRRKFRSVAQGTDWCQGAHSQTSRAFVIPKNCDPKLRSLILRAVMDLSLNLVSGFTTGSQLPRSKANKGLGPLERRSSPTWLCQ